jgi:beta-fructofuranosidase
MARSRLTRRAFVGTSAAALAASKLNALAFTDNAAKRLASDPLRPQCHLLPPGNWMNDPNGPIVWRGKVHLFYQINPKGADWGTISWGHAVSSDMVYWKHLPVALTPEAGSPDSYGVFSGSCIADGDRCLAFYTAVQLSDAAHATMPGTPPLHEQQMVAVSTDRELLHWIKQTQALIPNAPLMKVAGFRDPCVWRDGSTWYMAVGSGELGGEGMVLLYKATTPDGPKADWQYLHPLISAPGNGKDTKDPVDAGSMWECPNFFELDGHHVLLYSTERKVFWMTGTLDREALRFEPKQRGELDTGAYYAPKSMVGPKGERILWGWIPEKRPKEQYIAAGWAGVMSFPRVLNVDQYGYLRMKVAPAIDTALLTKAEQASTTEDIRAHIPGLAAKITAIVPAEGSGFTVSVGGKKLLDVRRVAAEHVAVNGEYLLAYLADGITAYIDGSVVEIFFGDRSAHTLRLYPELRASDTLTIAAKGFSSIVTAQQLKPISNNRLTK